MEKEFQSTGRAGRYFLFLILLLSFPKVHAEEQASIEIIRYDISLNIDPAGGIFHSAAELTLKASGNAGSAVLALNAWLNVEGVSASGRDLRYERKGDELTVFFEPQLRPGETLELLVAYSGKSRAGADHRWGVVTEDTSYMIYESLWYPSIHGQRAPARVSIVVPSGYQAVSSGELVTVEEGERMVYTYEDPVPAYGLSFVVGKFRVKATELVHGGKTGFDKETKRIVQAKAPRSTSSESSSRSIEILCFAREEDFYLADDCLRASKNILDFYEARFGPYPYKQFAVVEMPEDFFGGHGDQGFVLLQSNVFKRNSLEFTAHEIAHNWWGAHVAADGGYNFFPFQGIATSSSGTVSENLWLNEGFATYSSMLFLENENGRGALIDSLKAKRREYLDVRRDSPISSIGGDYGSPEYHAILYGKGALVVHMLRYVVGEESFWEIMHDYIDEYGGRSASLRDFQALAEKRYGGLDWFFEGWIHGAGAPDYAVADVAVSRCGDHYCTRAKVKQSGANLRMPLDVTLGTRGGDETKRIWMDGSSAVVEFESQSKPSSLELDKEYWILETDRTNNIAVIDPLSLAGVRALVRAAISRFD